MMKAEILAIVLIIIIGVMMTTAAHAQLRRKRMEMDEDSSEELVPQWRLNGNAINIYHIDFFF